MNTRVLLLLLLMIVGLAIALSAHPPGPTSIRSGPSTDSPSFAEGFLEQLSIVEAAANALVELGVSRERNLLIVGQRQSAMNAALDSTDTWLTQHAAHESDPAVIAYRTGAILIRQAMSDAQSAFFRLDWDDIAAANVTLQLGADQVTAAVSELDSGETS